jgi:hypothetical protein
MITFASAPLNSVISPTFLPDAGSNRAASGLFHLNASVGTVTHDSRDGFLTRVARKRHGIHPPAQTAEYAIIESSPKSDDPRW